MKRILKIIASSIHILSIKIIAKGIVLTKSSIYNVKFRNSGQSAVSVYKSIIENTSIICNGTNNRVNLNNCFIEHSEILIDGIDNSLILEKGVKLRKGQIVIRGNNCTVKIGENTTFGGVRIINAGVSNEISIGNDCLFSDNIEMWASDTHPIYNDSGNIINAEKPISIGNKVWVGSKVIILKGVKINDGCIIGMGTIVTKDIPKGVVSVGFPNKTVKENVRWSI